MVSLLADEGLIVGDYESIELSGKFREIAHIFALSLGLARFLPFVERVFSAIVAKYLVIIIGVPLVGELEPGGVFEQILYHSGVELWIAVKLSKLLSLAIKKHGKDVDSTHPAELYRLFQEVSLALGEGYDPLLVVLDVSEFSVFPFYWLGSFPVARGRSVRIFVN